MKKLMMTMLMGAVLASGAFGGSGELPAGYVKLDYIESRGGAYIDTGYHPTLKTRIVADFNPLATGFWRSFFGVTENDESIDGILMRYYDEEDKINGWFCNENYHEAQIGGVANKRIQVELKSGGMTVNGESAQITTTGTPYDGSIYIFSVNHKGEPYRSHAMRLYSFTIYDTVADVEKKMRDFVPCVRENDQAVGLYDLAESDSSKAFYANAGGGAFGVPDGFFSTVTVGTLAGMTVAWTFGDGTVTNAVKGTTFSVLFGTKNLAVIFTAADGCRFADDSTVKIVTRDEVTENLDLTDETPVAHRVQPRATITKITNRYPWNGKIDVECELSNLESPFSPIVAFATKFTSGDVEVTKTNDLSEAEQAAQTVRRTFDCRELFGEGKRDSQTQSSAAKLERFDYVVIDVSGGPTASSYPITYHTSAPEGGWNTDEYKTSKIVLYHVKEGMYWGNQKTEQTTTGFWIGVFEVTEAQYANVMEGFGSTTKPKSGVSYMTLRGTDDTYATVVGDSFLKRLCDRTGLDGFDLPTESQWEIACRAGTTTTYYWGDDKYLADDYMWHDRNSKAQTYEVGGKKPNEWGLYDMAGNVCEWCRDGYHLSLSVDSSADVCKGSEVGNDFVRRVLRGGSSNEDASNGGSSHRYNGYAGSSGFDIGFRLSRMSSKGEISETVNEPSGGDGDWTTGPSFAFDTREEKTIAGTEAETITYSGDGWGAGGSGVTVEYSLEGGEAVVLKTATDNGTVSWTPTLNGRYVFSHTVTGGTTETAVFVVNGLPGGEANPWAVGDGVTAYVKDRVLYLKGEGEVDEFAADAPWAEYDEVLEGAYLPRKVKVPASVLATLPISVKGGAEPSGAISPAEFDKVAIIDGKAQLDVSVYTSDTITNQNWSVATNGVIEVPAPGKQGFFYLMSKPKGK